MLRALPSIVDAGIEGQERDESVEAWYLHNDLYVAYDYRCLRSGAALLLHR